MFRKLEDPSVRNTLSIVVDGGKVGACEGETVAGVLLRGTSLFTRNTPVSGTLRSSYCLMGVCFECLAVVDGMPSVQTCLTTVKEGMRVERQRGPRDVLAHADSFSVGAPADSQEFAASAFTEAPRNE